MGGTSVTDALRRVPLFSKLSDEQLASVVRGTEIRLGPGEYIAREGEPPLGFFVQLEGRTEWTRRINGQEIHFATFDPGVFYGHELLLTDKPHPVSGRALDEVRLYKLEPNAFWSMLSACPQVLRVLVTTLAERWQNLGEVSQQHAKLISLGTMAAGLAHELNNPAAAARRGAGRLDELFGELPSLAIKLGRSCKTPEQLESLTRLQRDAGQHLASTPVSERLDPLEQSDREEELTDWLEEHGVEDGWELAPTLINVGVNTAQLDDVAARFDEDSIGDVLTWLSATLTGTELLGEIKQSASRISELVGAIKSYSYMDRAPVEEVNIHEGLENTLVILGHKLKRGSIVVSREYDKSLPHISAYGSELNQVWMNLIDNAIDALDDSGHITLRTARENDHMLVEVADDGPGIPEEIQDRIFEPFFTTKGVGEGTGLGLDMVYRTVQRHNGYIRLESTPGETRFQVRLPVVSGPGSNASHPREQEITP